MQSSTKTLLDETRALKISQKKVEYMGFLNLPLVPQLLPKSLI